MEILYQHNGLIFWTEQEILIRENMVRYFVDALKTSLEKLNSAFRMVRCEAPILTPRDLINPNYSPQDIYIPEEGLALRPETTMGSYAYAQHILNPHHSPKYRLPLVVWQLGKSFRNEQDKVLKHMRLKEFYQLEFQIIYSPDTKMDYPETLRQEVCKIISKQIGKCRLEPSDRIPWYSDNTTDVIFEPLNMEVCSMSQRTDFPGSKVFEVAVGICRLVHCFNETK
jgi:glycyl-tRNA synthetase